MNKWIILDPYQNPGLQILKLTCQDNFQVLHWPAGLFSAELSDIETIWHYLRLSGTFWCQTEIETRYLLPSALDIFSVLWYVTIWMLFMSWTEINFLKLKMWPSVASSLTIILVILFFFMASQQLAGNILAFFSLSYSSFIHNVRGR